MTRETTEVSNVRKELILHLKARVDQDEIDEAIRVAALARELNAISRLEHLQILEWLLDIQYEALGRLSSLNKEYGWPGGSGTKAERVRECPVQM